MIARIKKALNLRTNRELAEALGVHESQIVRWNKNGFHRSVGRLIDLLLDELEKAQEFADYRAFHARKK